MKKVLLSVLMTAAIGITSTFAHNHENKRSSEDRAKKKTEMLSEKLELTQDQKTQLLEINLRTAEQMQQIREEDPSRENTRGQAREIRLQQNEAIKGILTPTQAEQYDALKGEQRQKMKEKRGKGNGKGQGHIKGKGHHKGDGYERGENRERGEGHRKSQQKRPAK